MSNQGDFLVLVIGDLAYFGVPVYRKSQSHGKFSISTHAGLLLKVNWFS
jgi:hypothetical protein